jgi:hypothetical protein
MRKGIIALHKKKTEKEETMSEKSVSIISEDSEKIIWRTKLIINEKELALITGSLLAHVSYRIVKKNVTIGKTTVWKCPVIDCSYKFRQKEIFEGNSIYEEIYFHDHKNKEEMEEEEEDDDVIAEITSKFIKVVTLQCIESSPKVIYKSIINEIT